ncbi:MAG: beta-phosphoglucomutase [Bacteroidales bacterium]
MKKINACIFDMDGVLVSTEKYHFLAWRRLAETLGFTIDEEFNEQLKGVSRAVCIRLLLEYAGIHKSEAEKNELAQQKNEWYLEYISSIGPQDLLPGVLDFMNELQKHSIKMAVGSASKNAALLLKKLEIVHYFTAIVDGTQIEHPKPDPEVFLKGAEKMKVSPSDCVVFEDAQSGVQAAKSAGMYCVGIGDKKILSQADICVSGVHAISYNDIAYV